ncbi:cob(I)yrinic acid a,c-diamide adenosyltransferase [bacterium]|nr:cob(I)yrinic acid a,c-diamide adenosyltransferase [bacterium]
MKGYIQVYTGDGKGKTTAALGLALRAAGAGLKVFVAQFGKGRECGENRALDRLGDSVAVRRYGSGRFITEAPGSEDIHRAAEGLGEARDILVSGDYDLVILDEANVAVHLGLFSADDLLDVMNAKPGQVELVITGRDADPRVIERADLVTEMRMVKHYYSRGVKARRGIEL